MTKDSMDMRGAVALTGFSALLAYNQVVIKVVNQGLGPVFAAGLRSLLALFVLVLIFSLAGRRLTFPRKAWRGLALMSCLFGVEFVFLFLALDLTGVARASVIFYSMPIWMALGAHFWLGSDRLTPLRGVGLGLAMAGVVWAILDRPAGGSTSSMLGDLFALGAAICWAGIGLAARASGARHATPQAQLVVQHAFTAVLLIAIAPVFGPLIREFEVIHVSGMAFQVLAVASGGFLFWLWLLTIYPASSVASFSFLAPIFGVFFGWWLLDEPIGGEIFGALALVAVGLVLINRKKA